MAKMGRPTKYNPKYIDEVDVYLKECEDEYKLITESREVESVVRSEKDEDIDNQDEDTGYKIRKRRKAILKVKLPSVERFALRLNVCIKTLYNWENEDKNFLQALNKIRLEQKARLTEGGLSGEYNSTIAKLMLSSNHGMRDAVDNVSKVEVVVKDKEKVDDIINEYLNDNPGNTKRE